MTESAMAISSVVSFSYFGTHALPWPLPSSGQTSPVESPPETVHMASVVAPTQDLSCRRLPLLRSRRSKRGLLTDETLAGQASTNDGAEHAQEPGAVVALPRVVAERLLVQIPEQMKRFNADVGAFDRPLEQAPEVLQPIGVDVPPHIGFGMADDLVGVVRRQPLIRLKRIGEPQRRARRAGALRLAVPASG